MRTRQQEKVGIREVQELGIPAESCMGHVASDGSLLGKRASGEHVVGHFAQLDHDKEMEPLHAMYRSMEAELEVQCIVKRAELTAFL